MRAPILPLVLLASLVHPGCKDADDGDPSDSDGPEIQQAASMALATFSFATTEDGTSDGFDLDGKDGGCDIDDFPSPDGRTGIDNSFGPMLPAIEAAGGQALPELIQREVIEGGFQLVFSWTADASGQCEELTITRTWGSPMVSPAGELVPGQTFDPSPDPSLAPITVACTSLEDGGVRAEGFTLPVVLQVFSTKVALPLEGAVLEIRPTSDVSVYDGVIGGAIPMSVLRAFVEGLNGIGPTLPSLLQGVLDTRADVDGEDGPCSMMSAVVTFTTLPAYVFDEPPDVDWQDTDVGMVGDSDE